MTMKVEAEPSSISEPTTAFRSDSPRNAHERGEDPVHLGAPGEDKPYDLVGAGYGPAGIALAVAMEDAEEQDPQRQRSRTLFVERAPDSSWQPDMLMLGTDIQHHYLRDFATPRNPRSRFTFPCYLKEKGRLFSFGLLGGNAGRTEWNDYVRWVAEQVSDRALYGHELVAAEPVVLEGTSRVNLLRVHTRQLSDNTKGMVYARNLVVCTGRRPNIPSQYAPFIGPQMFHSHTFLRSLHALPPRERPTFAVIGSGQNAIEIILHLADHFPSSEIISINRNSGFRIYDLGHFSNEVYFPEDVEYFFSLTKQNRQRLYDDVKFTNYSSVDFDVSRALYWRIYEEGVRGTRRIHVLKRSSVTEVKRQDDQFHLQLDDIYRHDKRGVKADVVILSTGYMEEQVPEILEPLRPYLKLDSDGDLRVSRDYEVATDDRLQAGIYLNGLTERTHGISDAASFSMMALKAQRILEALDARKTRHGEAAASEQKVTV